MGVGDTLTVSPDSNQLFLPNSTLFSTVFNVNFGTCDWPSVFQLPDQMSILRETWLDQLILALCRKQSVHNSFDTNSPAFVSLSILLPVKSKFI